MNTQFVNPHSPSYEQDQRIGGLHSAGGQDEHHEKKSVIKKVKAKAKKIKSTIGSKIHGGHDHEHEQHNPDQDMDEEDDFGDELEQDPVVHGAPRYDSAAVKMGNENLKSGPTHLNVMDKGNTGPAGISFGEEGVPGPKRTDFDMKSSSGPTKVDLHDKVHTGLSKPDLGMSKIGESKTGLSIHNSPLETDPNASKDHFGLDLHDKAHTGKSQPDLGMSKTGLGIHNSPLEKDPNASKDHFGLDLHDKAHTGQSKPDWGMSKTVESTTGLGIHNSPLETDPNASKDHFGLDLHDKAHTGQSKPDLGMSKTGESKTVSGIHAPLERDPNAPIDHSGNVTSGNYQSKVTDPTGAGAKEADVEPITRSFRKMEVNNETGQKPALTGTGSHDQFSPDSTATKSVPHQGFETKTDNMNVDEKPNRNPSYTEKITSGTSAMAGYAGSALTGTAASAKNVVGSATSTVTGTAVSAKNAVASKLGYGGNDNSNIATQDTHLTRNVGTHSGDQTKSSTAEVDDHGNPSNTGKITSGTSAIAGYAGSALTGTAASAKNVVGSATSTVTGTAASAKNAVASKLGYGGNDNSNIATQDTHLTRNEGTHTGDQTKSSTAEVGDHGNPSHTGKITSGTPAIAGYAGSALSGTAASARNVVGSATSTLTGTAVAAKSAVASKLGYGGNANSNIATQDTHSTHNEGAHTGDQTKSSIAAVGGYGRQISSTVSEKLAPVYGTVAGVGSAIVTPVYEKVAGAGSVVKSKIQGTGSNTGTGTRVDAGTGTGTGGVGSVTEQDKRGVSVKDYLVHKLSPGDEDKALSEVISGVVPKKKDEFPDTVAQNMDVTDSTEVARSLGTGEHEYRKDGDHQGYGNDGSSIGGGVGSPGGAGMVGRVKGVVSSWFGKGTGDQITDEQKSSGGVGEREEGHENSSTGVVH